MMGDWELLQAYVKHRSDAVFAELVRRHLDWVYSAALRQTRDPHLAEDVAQSVFVLLARKADKLRPGTIVSGWLFRTTLFVAASAIRAERRRKIREEKAVAMAPLTTSCPEDDIPWNQLTPHLDQSVAALSKTDRSAILLRFYEQKSLREVGQQLGLSEDAAKKRVTRAIEKLRKSLTRRGAVLSATALAVEMAEHSVQAVPTSFATTVLQTATASTSASAVLPQLARETLRAWRIAKLSLASGIAVVALTGAFLAVNATRPPGTAGDRLPQAEQSDMTTAPVANTPRTPGNVAVTSLIASNRAIEITVIDARSKTPLAGAAVTIWKQRQKTTGFTDGRGRYQIELPENDPPHLSVAAHRYGFVPMRVDWNTLGGTFHLPTEFTFTLEPATSIGGVVEDEQGQPIAGASVFVLLRGSSMDSASEELFVDVNDYKVVTDAQGRWRFDQAPGDLSDLSIRLAHPDYISDAYHNDTPVPPVEKLRDMTAVMVMKKGLSLTGIVVDSQGEPIPNASVAQGSDRNGTTFPKTKTDAQGHFAFGNVKPGQVVLTVRAEGYAPELKMTEADSQTQPLEIRLTKGFVIRGRVVDRDGKPISGAGVAADTWRTHRSLTWRTETDGAGRFVWSNAPPDEVQFDVFKDGYSRNDLHGLTPSDEEQIITLLPLLRIHGTVVDADTGQPITNFDVVPGNLFDDAGSATWNTYGTIHSTNGQYEIALDGAPNQHEQSITVPRADGELVTTTNTVSGARLIHVEAEGYLPATSREFVSGETTAAADFKLVRSAWIQGVVRTADGQPAANVEVFLVTPGLPLVVENGHRGSGQAATSVLTGDDGRFEFSPPGKPFLVVALHDKGYAQAASEHPGTLPDLVLRPWARIDGAMYIGSRAAARQKVSLGMDWARQSDDQPSVLFEANTMTDDTGHFLLDHVPAGDVIVVRWICSNERFQTFEATRSVRLHTDFGQTAQVTIGGTGRPVVGQLVVAAGFERKVDWSACDSSVLLTLPELPKPTLPNDWAGMTEERKQAWYKQWRNSWNTSDEGRAYWKTFRAYPFAVRPDGSFRVEDVEPGIYHFDVILRGEPRTNGAAIVRQPIAWLKHEFTVPEMPEERSDEPLDLGDLELQPVPQQH
ncbi:MAG TPA: sigma-70 family RNA polymerase sigma factor [Verrucomicrobiae bacterium]|nr:sigma-70 family RNA polymerase sigma factor [Verrucomicrobiae bacterium]